MKKYLACLASLILVACSPKGSNSNDPQDLGQYVNPMIGTDWVGNTYPGASAPFGMVQLSPDNGLPGWDRIAGYYYPDSTIAGFSHTHLSGTGAGDMYDISFMPVIAPALVGEEPLGIHAKFSHETERAYAGYYAVKLEPYDIQVELTATEHIGVQRYTFERASDSAFVYLNLHKAMNWDRTLGTELRLSADKRELRGTRLSDGWARGQAVHFYTRLSQAPEAVEIDTIAITGEGQEPTRWGYIAKLHYKVKAGDSLVIETALSGVSPEGAEANYRAERQPSFDHYLKGSRLAWQKHLATIQLPDTTATDDKKVFYTALYHSLICPTIYSDTDGTYLGADRAKHTTKGKHYSTFSLWDTYRTAHPLYNIILPQESQDMTQSMVDFGVQNKGHLPVWSMWASETDMMIGHHSIPVIAAALSAGVYQPKDRETLLSALRTTLNRQGYRAMDEYRQYGYVPSDVHRESLSLTLEYAYNDWAGAKIFEALGLREEAKRYYDRSRNYRNLWDTERGFFRPRLKSGAFKPQFDEFAYTEDVTESNAYQYLWSVQHDIAGLIELMGGKDSLVRRLDAFFSAETPSHIELPIFSTGMMGQYAHGNEPGHHTAFLYHYADRPWRTTDRVHHILKTLYTNAPNGLCGNEDCGQMSAWYVMSAIGLYPVEASHEYLITSPLYPEVLISPRGAKPFRIKAQGLSAQRKYIKSVKLNGKAYTERSLPIQLIQAGGELELEMTDETGHCWYR